MQTFKKCLALITGKGDSMNVLVKEITGIIDLNCKGCPVASAIQRNHGDYKKQKYCKGLCPYGVKMGKLSKELSYGADTSKALELDYETYIIHKEQGMTDREICKKYKIGSSTLYTRKAAWNVPRQRSPKNKKFDTLDKKEYYALKLENFTDKEIAKLWGIGNETLNRFKKHHNIKGGLDPNNKVEQAGLTKEIYLKHRLDGLPDYKIARLIGVGKNTLVAWKKRMNLRG
jgi:transposase